MQEQSDPASLIIEQANKILNNGGKQTTTDIGAELENLGIRKIYSPTINEVREAYVQIDCETIDTYYNNYMNGANRAHVQIPLPIIDVVKATDIRVYHSNPIPCDCDNDWAIERLSSDYKFNYMGYDLVKGCLAFKGQIRLFDKFLEAASMAFSKGYVHMAYVRPRGLHIPIDGLNRGLNYEEFASQIEIVDCLLFLKDPHHIADNNRNEGHAGNEGFATPPPTNFPTGSPFFVQGQEVPEQETDTRAFGVHPPTYLPADHSVAVQSQEPNLHENYAAEPNWNAMDFSQFFHQSVPRLPYTNLPVQDSEANHQLLYYNVFVDGQPDGSYSNPA